MSDEIQPKEFYTVADVAVLFDIQPATVRDWLRSGKLQGIRPGGRHWRVSHAELQRFATKEHGA